MLYSDGVHLISDCGVARLHERCEVLGIKRCWFHNTKKFPHYDIPKRMRYNFFWVNNDIARVSSQEIVRILKRDRYENKNND